MSCDVIISTAAPSLIWGGVIAIIYTTAIIMVVNTLLDVADTLGDLRLHECIRHHRGGQHAS